MTLPREVREFVRQRAEGVCEYCHLPEIASVLPHQVDHIIGRQHRGADDEDNLCLSCIRCNLKKGPNIASLDPETRLVVALYHPRLQEWEQHFSIGTDATVRGLSAEGRTTVDLLDMNDADRARLRAMVLRRGRHP